MPSLYRVYRKSQTYQYTLQKMDTSWQCYLLTIITYIGVVQVAAVFSEKSYIMYVLLLCAADHLVPAIFPVLTTRLERAYAASSNIFHPAQYYLAPFLVFLFLRSFRLMPNCCTLRCSADYWNSESSEYGS